MKINFYYSTSLDQKINVINAINGLDSDSKVGIMTITISNSNRWSEELLNTMIKRYQNIYDIWIYDLNSSVDNEMHGLV